MSMSEFKNLEAPEPKGQSKTPESQSLDDTVREYFETHPSVFAERPEVLAKLGSEKLLTKRQQLEEGFAELATLQVEAGNSGISADLNDSLEVRIESYRALRDAVTDALEISTDKERERREQKDRVALEKAHKRLSESLGIVEENKKSGLKRKAA